MPVESKRDAAKVVKTKELAAKVVKTKEFKSSSRSKNFPMPKLNRRIEMDPFLQQHLGLDDVEFINRVSAKLKKPDECALMFIMGNLDAVHAALAVSGAPVKPGTTPAASGERLLEYLDAAASTVGDLASRRMLGVNSVAFYGLNVQHTVAILSQKWGNVKWFSNIRAQKLESVGKALILGGSSPGVRVSELTSVFA